MSESSRIAVPVRILVVDDRSDNLIAMEAILKAYHDYQICTAKSGAEAIEQVKQSEFALILMDIQMPDMDGYETVRRIKELSGGRNVPIIFVTAIYREDPHVLKGYSVGAIDYICKPLNPDVLKAKVDIYASLYIKSHRLMLLQNQSIEENARLREENERLRAKLKSLQQR